MLVGRYRQKTGRLGRRDRQARLGLVGWGPEGRSGGISGFGRASTASIVRLSIGKSGPVGTEVLAPGRSAFANGQMSWGDVAFDAISSRMCSGTWPAHERCTRVTSAR